MSVLSLFDVLTRCVLVMMCFPRYTSAYDPQSALMERLFSHYISDLLPSCPNDSSKVTVNMDLSIRGVLDVDAPSQVISTYVWQRWSWHDCRLTWNASDFDGIEKILVSSQRLWIPDITVYDSVGGASVEEAVRMYRAIIHSSGKVNLLFPIIIQSTCKLDVTYFPYDRQVCQMVFASWSYTGDEIDLVNISNAGDTSVFVDNGEWNLIAVPCQRLLQLYPCCDEPFPVIIYHLVLQREHLYYQFNLILPCILITAIALLVFCLPPESGEKMSLGITVLLSLTVFLLMVADRMPATSDTIPLIGQYVGATIIIVSLSCCMTVLTLHVHHKGKDGRPVPAWVYMLTVRCLGRVLCMAESKPQGSAVLHRQDAVNGRQSYKLQDINSSTYHPGSPTTTSTHLLGPLSSASGSGSIHGFSELQASLVRQQREAQLAAEWRLVAMTLDRLFLVITTIATVAITCVVLHARPERHNEPGVKEDPAAILDDIIAGVK